MRVRLTQIDGKLPNLALMRLAAYHRKRGDEVVFTKDAQRSLLEGSYDKVYASVIFSFSEKKLNIFKAHFPDAIIGGTGSGNWTTLDHIPNEYDYADYPDYEYSIGFLTRGCRLKCKFCVVPKKEGRPQQSMTVNDLWRGEPYPKQLHLLDNDFFGVPGWEKHVDDIVDGDFQICLNQGINVRLITEQAAEALARMRYMDDQFTSRRLYTAWDNLGDEKIFFRGIDRLEKHGVPPHHVMAYMLIGYKKGETMDDIMYRHEKMVARGIKPYPMVYDNKRKDLKRFQRWVIRRYYQFIPFSEYRTDATAIVDPVRRMAVLPFVN